METVKNIEELRSAIANNETEIVLAESGDFVDESANFDESQLVSLVKKDGITIRSEDANNPETLVGLKISNSENIIVENVEFTGWDKSDPNAGEKPAAAQVENSNDVVFSGVTFETRDDFESILFGIRVKNSDDFTVENSQFFNLREGFKSINSSNLTVTGNEFADLIVDAIDISNRNGDSLESITIENNIIRDFDPDVTKQNGEHPDAMQFTVFDDSVDETISIKNNVALMGDGSSFQGMIISTREGGSANNFEIENNLIHTTSATGILIANGKNIDIARNTIVFRDSQPAETVDGNLVDKTKISLVNVENAVVEDNIAGKFIINGEKFGGEVSAPEPTDGNISTNSESLIVGPDIPYEEVFVKGEMLSDPEFYSTISPEDFAVLNSIDAGANLDALPDATAGELISEPEPEPNPDSILISLGNANDRGDVFGTAEADFMEANANTSNDKLRGLGRDGNDTLIGANNVDLSGGNGDDLLILNGGDSFITGGSGSDEFVITSDTESGSNILDFEQGIDTIEFRAIQGISSFFDLDITPQNRNFTANSFINFGDEQIKVKGVMVEEFSAQDFNFS